MDIFLVRHGEAAASWGQSADPGLSELGQEQARSAAQDLQPRVADNLQLISSPLARARETATPLAAALGLDVRVDEAFAEIRAPVPLAERQAWLRQFMQQQWNEQAESLHLWRRQAVDELLKLDQPAVVFTHFLIINAVVGKIQGAEATLCCWPDNGSVTHLRLAGGTLELVALGAQMNTFVN
jgi:probable phosphoglycerate mutase